MRRLASQRFEWIVLGVYAVLVFGIIPFHEPWRDEAQSWLIARDLPLAGILRQMGYEGTPGLWHLLQAPLAKAGAPFTSLLVLNAAVACAAVAVLLFRAPFRPWQKAAFAFSFLMLAELGVVARNYGLAALLLFTTAALFPARTRRPLAYATAVALLANSFTTMAGVALLLFALYALETWRTRAALERPRVLGAWAIMAAGIALAALQVRPPPDVFNQGLAPEFHPKAPLEMLRAVFFGGAGGAWTGPLAVLGFWWVLRDLRPRRDLLAVAATSFVAWQYLFVLKYHASFRHYALMGVLLVALLWMLRAESAGAIVPLARRWPRVRWPRAFATLGAGEALLFAGLALSCVHVLDSLRDEVQRPFSNAEEMARYIRARGIGARIASYKSPHASGLLPWLPGRRWYSIEDGQPRTFLTWTPLFDWRNPLTPVEAVMRARLFWPADPPWLLLNEALPRPERFDYRLVYHTSARPTREDSETFWLYEPVDGAVTTERAERWAFSDVGTVGAELARPSPPQGNSDRNPRSAASASGSPSAGAHAARSAGPGAT